MNDDHDPHAELPHHQDIPPPVYHPPTMSPEPPTRRVHQYAFMVGCGVVVVVCTVWLIVSYITRTNEANQSTEAAQRLCRQLNTVGQPCSTHAPGTVEGVSGDPQMPAPAASLTGSPVAGSRAPGDPPPTDGEGIPQAFQPSEGALIISVNVQEGRLVLTFDDGARVDAGPVNEETLAIVLRTLPSISPSPSPSPSYPAGADGPDPTDTASPEATPQESPS